MSIGREHLGRLMSDLVSDSADEREAAAETVSDWADSPGTYSDFEARMLVRTLALAAAAEDSTIAREAELNALTNLFSSKSMSAVDVTPVLNMSTADLGPSELEHIEGLRALSDVS